MTQTKTREAEAVTSHLSKNNNDHGELDSPYKPESSDIPAKNDSEIISGLSEDNDLNTLDKLKEATKQLAKTHDKFPKLENITEATITLLECGEQSTELKGICYKLLYAINDNIKENHNELRSGVRCEDASPILYERIWRRISIGNTLFELKGAFTNALNVEHKIKLSQKDNDLGMWNYLARRRLKRKKGSI